MGLLYSFVDLNDEQKHARRILLNRYGFTAQVSVVLPLLVVQIYFLATWWTARSRRYNSLSSPSSPVRKSTQANRTYSIRSLMILLQKFLWWCGDDFGAQLGTNGEVLGGIAWLAWLLLLSFLQTGDDYLHLTKRFGIVAASQLPFHYLLAVKTPYSPLQHLTHASHETLNAIHQALGRVVTTLLYLHVAFYINFYVQSGLLLSKLQEAYVICGALAIIMFTIIGTSSLAVVRRWSYRTFLAIHIVLSIALLPILFFHVQHIRIYIYETLVVLVLNLVSRAVTAKSYTTARISKIPETDMLDISVASPSKSIAARWLPGQHAYLSLPGQAFKFALAKNPFTLSSIPTTDGCLRFIARIQSGNTAALARAASSGKTVHQLLVEGPYGMTHSDRLLEYDRVLMIAGGVGATFIVPLYRQLLSDLSPSKGSYRRQKVSAVWAVRSSADIAWAIPKDQAEREGFADRLHVFVTRTNEPDLVQDTLTELYGKLPRSDGDDGGIELEERSNLLSKEASSEPLTAGNVSYHSGRPDIARLIDQAFSGPSSDRIAIVICGPRSLGQSVRKQVARWVYRGREVWFWEESFAL